MNMVMTFDTKETAQLIREQLHAKYNFSKSVRHTSAGYAHETKIEFSVLVDGVPYDNVEIIAKAII